MNYSNNDSIMTENCLYLLHPQPLATLLYATPEWVIAQATKGYTGVYTDDAMGTDEQDKFWRELGDTKLKGPLEMANTFWLIEDVTRAFTHQLARYRLGVSMVQESMRFSKQDKKLAHIMVPSNIVNNSSGLEQFVDSCETAMQTYHTMTATPGINIEDARAILPTHICTRLYLNVNLSALAHIYDQRYCCQAQGSNLDEQGEWKQIVTQMKEELVAHGYNHYAATLAAPWENPLCVSCGFGASFDRPCTYANKFSNNLEALAKKAGMLSVY